jgi:yecA family protein
MIQMNNQSTESHITDADLDWLEQTLLNRVDESKYSEEMDEGIVELSELDGYFTAIVSAPTMIPPSQWIPGIWGDFEPEWEDAAELEKALGIMIEIMESIIFSLMEEPDEYAPLFLESERDGKKHLLVDEWCFGYLRGMGLCVNDWKIEHEPMLSLLMPIVMFGSDAMFEIYESLDSSEITALKQQLTPNIKQIHSYWLAQRENELYGNKAYSMTTKTIPEYSNEYLQTLSVAELIQLMIDDEDRVPRNVIDECANRADKMIEALLPLATPATEQKEESSGRWWVRLHALMILGLIPGEKAGQALIPFIDYINQEEEGDLKDWFAGYWPALTHNKPQSVLEKLRELSESPHYDWYTRNCLTEAVIDNAREQGDEALDKALDWLAALVADENQDWEFRLASANLLLDFPRERYRQLLDQMEALQEGMGVYFDKKDINKAYSAKKDRPEWEQERDPWDFYQPQAINARQQRWQEESAWNTGPENDDEDDLFEESGKRYNFGVQQPYERETPKVGRNDPCPCGSGKKYKKCCLH